MSKEILIKTDQDEKGTVFTVEEKDVPADTQEKDGRYAVTAYTKNENGGTYTYSPTFWVSRPQRVPVKTWAKRGRIFGASLVNRKAGVGIQVPKEGGMFDLIPGYWQLSVTGTWHPPGGIFASATYD